MNKCLYCTFGEDADFTVEDLKQHIESECDFFHPLRKLHRGSALYPVFTKDSVWRVIEAEEEYTNAQTWGQQQAERAIRAEQRAEQAEAQVRALQAEVQDERAGKMAMHEIAGEWEAQVRMMENVHKEQMADMQSVYEAQVRALQKDLDEVAESQRELSDDNESLRSQVRALREALEEMIHESMYTSGAWFKSRAQDALAVSATPPASQPVLCSSRSPVGDAPCVRPKGHEGEHYGGGAVWHEPASQPGREERG